MASVLIVDDHQGTLDTFATVLRHAGHVTATAATGFAGIALARSRPFDLHLVDLRLPDMSGLDVVRELKKQGVTAPMVVVTSFPSFDTSFDAAVSGAAGYVEGMLLPDELVAVVVDALQGRHPVRHPARVSAGADHCVKQVPMVDARVTQITRVIDANLGKSMSAGQIAHMLDMSESRVRHLFRERVGVPLIGFWKERRLQVSAIRLVTTTDYVGQIANSLGFSSLKEFSKAFRRRFGLAPTVYRARFWRG